MRKPGKIVRTAVTCAAVGGAAVLAVLHSQGAARPDASVSVIRDAPARVVRDGAGATPASRKLSGPVVQSVVPTLTPALRNLPPAPAVPRIEREPEVPLRPVGPGPANWRDPLLPRNKATRDMPGSTSFDGIANLCGCLPPDTEGDVGPNHYVEWINLHLAIFNKTGGQIGTTVTGNTLFQSLTPGHFCRESNNGDPLVHYDQLADRWVLSQFAFSPAGFGPYYECVAVSTTPDPTGSYCLYPFQTAVTVFPDYPKMGVWPDAYYFSFAAFPDVQFTDGQTYSPGVMAVERAKMLACQPAQMVYFDHENLPALGQDDERLLPSDLDGASLPPSGEPNYFLGPNTTTNNKLEQWEFDVDWTTPANSTFTHTHSIPVTTFDPTIVCNPVPRGCVPQQGTTTRLDAFTNPTRARLMYELNYRNFGTHRSLVANHNVDVSTNLVGTRWYEIRNPEGTPAVFQSGAVDASDGVHRWMGSVAMDKKGDLAIGYSASSGSMFPAIRYSGRLRADPLGQLTQGEATMHPGTGSQTSTSSRWGDYSRLTVDPVDDCTFWYINEYLAVTSSASWRTRIGNFVFPECLQPTAVRVATFAARWRGKAVHATWHTASEAGVAGFHVYRSAGVKPFRRITPALVPAKRAGQASGASYRLIDRTVRGGTTYSYRLQVVSTSGKRTWHTIGAAAAT